MILSFERQESVGINVLLQKKCGSKTQNNEIYNPCFCILYPCKQFVSMLNIAHCKTG